MSLHGSAARRRRLLGRLQRTVYCCSIDEYLRASQPLSDAQRVATARRMNGDANTTIGSMASHESSQDVSQSPTVDPLIGEAVNVAIAVDKPVVIAACVTP